MHSQIKRHAEILSNILSEIEDLRIELRAAVEAAEADGVDKRALLKVAREMVMDSEKLSKRIAAEEQLDLFRNEVGLLKRKGLEGS